jgi:PKD domain
MLIRRAVLTLFALALLAPSTAAAIPNGGGGTGPDPDAWPTARLSAPEHALQYSNVTLDASGSSDDDGHIVRYEWDFNGQPGWDRTTTSPRTTAYFGGYVNYTVKVRVTDNSGHQSTASAVIRVHPGPRARFFVAPQQPTAGKAAVLVAKDSYASAGNPKFDWDLDGNGSYETPSSHGGYEPDYRVTFATAGQHTVGLRVTDRDGYTATTTVTFTVKRARPLDGAQAPNSGVLSRA